MPSRKPQYMLTLGFLVIVGAVGPFQAVRELQQSQTPQVLDLFRHTPDAAHLRSFEDDLESESIVASTVRPWMQYARYRVLRDTGEKALVGRAQWWFYRPDVRFLMERCVDDPANRLGPAAAVAAIVDFRDQLARRGIKLLVVPVPGKPSVYPDRITRRAAPCDPRVHEHTRQVLNALTAAGVETVDLLDTFAAARQADADAASADPLYLVADTHWTNTGARLAARAVADRLGDLDWVSAGSTAYDTEEVEVRRIGDVLRMLECSPIKSLFDPQTVICERVIHRDDRKPYRDDPTSPILVLGDSFLRIYERDEPGSAGFIAHLARNLGRPLASIVNDGGASTLVRQELARRPDLLEGKKLVIYEFVERDVRFGMDGWQPVLLGGRASSAPLGD